MEKQNRQQKEYQERSNSIKIEEKTEEKIEEKIKEKDKKTADILSREICGKFKKIGHATPAFPPPYD